MSVSKSLGELRSAELSHGTVEWRERGDSPPVVVLHAFMVNGDHWRHVVAQLARHVRCITPELPIGAHVTSLAPDADLSMAGRADLLVAFLDMLELERATIVECDSGGVLAQVVIAWHAVRVDRLVPVCCDAFEDFPARRFRFITVLPRIPGSLLVVALLMLIRPVRRSGLGYGAVMRADPEREVRASFLRPARGAPTRRDVAKVIRAIDPHVTLAAESTFVGRHHPVLAWSADERMFDRTSAARLTNAFPNATLTTIPGARPYIAEEAPLALSAAIIEHVGTDVSMEAHAGVGR